MSLPSAIRITSPSPRAALIFFHGLGDSGEGWSWFPQLIKGANIIPRATADLINYVFPNAPEVPITLNRGYRMPAWFDIIELASANSPQDTAGFLKSCQVAQRFIKEQMEQYNIPADKIIIGGFLQGAAVALGALALLDFKIGGAIVLSGFCPARDEVARLHTSANYDTPIFQGHGNIDNVVAFEFGQQTAQLYRGLGFKKLTFKEYANLAHSAGEDELKHVQEVIRDILAVK